MPDQGDLTVTFVRNFGLRTLIEETDRGKHEYKSLCAGQPEFESAARLELDNKPEEGGLQQGVQPQHRGCMVPAVVVSGAVLWWLLLR